jgi:hypothetical protein
MYQIDLNQLIRSPCSINGELWWRVDNFLREVGAKAPSESVAEKPRHLVSTNFVRLSRQDG